MTHQEKADIQLLLEAFGRDWMRPDVSEAYDRLKAASQMAGRACDCSACRIGYPAVTVDYGEQ